MTDINYAARYLVYIMRKFGITTGDRNPFNRDLRTLLRKSSKTSWTAVAAVVSKAKRPPLTRQRRIPV